MVNTLKNVIIYYSSEILFSLANGTLMQDSMNVISDLIMSLFDELKRILKTGMQKVINLMGGEYEFLLEIFEYICDIIENLIGKLMDFSEYLAELLDDEISNFFSELSFLEDATNYYTNDDEVESSKGEYQRLNEENEGICDYSGTHKKAWLKETEAPPRFTFFLSLIFILLGIAGVGTSIIDKIIDIVKLAKDIKIALSGLAGAGVAALVTTAWAMIQNWVETNIKSIIKVLAATLLIWIGYEIDEGEFYLLWIPGALISTVIAVVAMSLAISTFGGSCPPLQVISGIALVASIVEAIASIGFWIWLAADEDDDGLCNGDEKFSTWVVWTYDIHFGHTAIEVKNLNLEEEDTDGDGIHDFRELDPNNRETLITSDEAFYVTDPTNEDTDNDGIWDGLFSNNIRKVFYIDKDGERKDYGETSWKYGPQGDEPYRHALIKGI